MVSRRGRWNRWLIPALALALVAPTWTFGPRAQEAGKGTLTGLVLDPAGNPAPSFRLVFRSEREGREYVSEPSDAQGRYSISLPAGESYLLVSAVAPDGQKLRVPPLPAVPVEEGVRRLDLRFQYPKPEEAPPARVRSDRGIPWWQIGTAVVAVVVFSSAVFDDDEPEPRVSPFTPGP